MSQFPKKSELNTSLSTLDLPFIDIVLAERFLLPPAALRKQGLRVPATFGELVEDSGMGFDDVVRILGDCIQVNQLIWTDTPVDKFVSSSDCWLIDMRPEVTFETEPLHPDARVFHLGNPAAQLQIMRTLRSVLVISSTPEHDWSAAMSLRSMGVNSFVSKF